jgi:cell wall-associated NlpC family hydrolase
VSAVPNPGDVFVTRTGGFVAWAIRRLTHSTVNHAGVYIGQGEIIEADPRDGLRYNGATEYPSAQWSAYPLTDAQRAAIVKWSVDHLGIGYNFLDIVALGLAYSVHVPTPKWARRRLDSDRTLICSQAAAMALRAAGVDPRPGEASGEITPEDLRVWMTADARTHSRTG